MKFVLNDQIVLSRAPEGPLGHYIASFSEWVSGQGYALFSWRYRIRLVAGFSRWLAERNVCLRSISTAHSVAYLQSRARRRRLRGEDATVLAQLLDFPRHRGVIGAEKIGPPQLSPVDRCVEAFERHLREERALTRATIVNYVPFVRGFLNDCFGSGPVVLSRLSAKDVRAVCATPGTATAFEASQASDDRAALVPALWALSGEYQVGPRRSRSRRGELVDVVDSSWRTCCGAWTAIHWPSRLSGARSVSDP